MNQVNVIKAATNTQKNVETRKRKTMERENTLSDGDYRCFLSRVRVSKIEPLLCEKSVPI